VCALLVVVCTAIAVPSNATSSSVGADVRPAVVPAGLKTRLYDTPNSTPSDAWGVEERGSIDPAVLDLALGAVACAVKSGSIDDPSTLTVIDYSRPSTEKRLWVFDLHSRALLYEELVAHGKGSGDDLATQFSNEPDSHQSSLGLFLTEDTYVGRNGYSLRLRGLDEGFNDLAYERAIVMHGAPYVGEEFARTMGRLGRSWGCPALREGVARAVIDRVKGSGLVFSYYPDQNWLRSSKFLGGCRG